MPNHTPTTNATVSRGGAGPADPIADDNEDQERLAHAELIANGHGDRERLDRADEPLAHLSDVRSLGGIAR